MSEKHDLPSDSDEDDEDYLPEGQSSSSEGDSEIEKKSDIEDEIPGNDNKVQKRTKKRKNKASKRRKNQEMPCSNEDVDENDEQVKEKNSEEEKKRADSLWADFLKDSPVVSKPKNTTNNTNSAKSDNSSTKSKVEEKVTVTKIVEFAGEKITIEKEIFANSTKVENSVSKSENTRNVTMSSAVKEKQSNDQGVRKAGLGGISAVLGRLGKKTKISTLEKSKLDWDNFKKQEDIEEEISSHNRGKDGYLERQDFLQRADFRQFEIEKQLRNTSRRSNR